MGRARPRQALTVVTTGGYSSGMHSVGIKILKARLSEYVRLVKRGDTILVTERDQVVAELRPARRKSQGPPGLAEHLAALAERGEATLRTKSPRSWTPPRRKSRALPLSSTEILEALRQDRS